MHVFSSSFCQQQQGLNVCSSCIVHPYLEHVLRMVIIDVAGIFITCIKNISGCSMRPELENLYLMEMLPNFLIE